MAVAQQPDLATQLMNMMAFSPAMGQNMMGAAAMVNAGANAAAPLMQMGAQAMQNAAMPGYQQNLANSAAASAAYGPEAQLGSAYANLAGQLETAPYQTEAAIMGGLPQAESQTATGLANASAGNYQSQLQSLLQAYLGGSFGAQATNAGNLAALNQLGPLQQTNVMAPVQLATGTLPSLAGLEGQTINASTLPEQLAASEYMQGLTPQVLGQQQQAATEFTQGITPQVLQELQQQGGLYGTALSGNQGLLQNQLTQNAGIENTNTQAQLGALQAALPTETQAMLGTQGNNLQGATSNLNALAGLEQGAQGILGQAYLQPQQLTAQGQMNNTNAGVNYGVPSLQALEQGGLAGQANTLSGQEQTQQLGQQLASQILGQNYGAATQIPGLESQNYANQLAAQSPVLQSEVNAAIQPTLAGIGQLGSLGNANIAAQIQGGMNAQNNYANLVNHLGGDAIMAQALSNLIGSSNHQIGVSPQTSGLAGGTMPLAAPIPAPPTSITGFNQQGNPFQSESLNLANAPNSGGATSASTGASQPDLSSEIAHDLGAAISEIPAFSNPYSSSNAAGDMAAVMSEANKPTFSPLHGLSSAPYLSDAFSANPAEGNALLSPIQSFGNSYTGPVLTPTYSGSYSDQLAAPASSFGIPEVGQFSNTFSPNTSLGLGENLSSPLLSAPSGNWMSGLTQTNAPQTALAEASNPSAPSLPDVSGLLSSLTQEPNTSSGPLTQFLSSLSQQQAAHPGINPWTGTANQQLSLPGAPNYQMPNFGAPNWNVQAPSMPSFAQMFGAMGGSTAAQPTSSPNLTYGYGAIPTR